MANDFDAVNAIMEDFPWLRELGNNIYDLLVGLVIADTPYESVAAQIRQTDEYKARFAGMATRQQKGLAPITEYEYMQIEDSYREQLRSYGLFPHFSTTDEQWKGFTASQIGEDVSPTEFSQRLDGGYASVVDAAPTVQQAFEEFYGVQPTQDAMLLYFLDPGRGLGEIEKQVAAATVGGAAYRYGLNITRTRAELLRASGVTEAFARQGFADVAREEPQLKKLANMQQFNPLSQTDLEEFFFHEDPTVAEKRTRIFQTALSEFQAGSPARTSREGGLSSLIDRRRTV